MDIVILYVVYCEDTKYFIGVRELVQMKLGVLFVNVVRGGVVDDVVLCVVVEFGWIWVVVDVFEDESVGGVIEFLFLFKDVDGFYGIYYIGVSTVQV